MAQSPPIFIGTAGWAIRREYQHLFEPGASHLARYAARFNGVEINSSFYRPHRPATYAKWAASVPAGFRFAVKIPRAITHDARLVGSEDALEKFLSECMALGGRLGPLLIQLPPSLTFDRAVAGAFFAALRARTDMAAVLEPRHPSWFSEPCATLLRKFRIARAAVDPVPAGVECAAEPGGDRSTVYFRLHGSPRIYYSDYSDAYLQTLATRLRAAQHAGSQAWCIFDNTALGHATNNARTLQTILSQR
jgi:uncharacterized protein YecE (DUF72 family)